MDLQAILQSVRDGSLSVDSAATKLQGFEDLGHSRVDLRRAERNGAAEVIFGQNKTTEQIVEIMHSLSDRGENVLATRIKPETALTLKANFPGLTYHDLSGLVMLRHKAVEAAPTKVAVVCAGTSDLSVAEEAALTAEFYGNPIERVYDAGVAGLHRLLASLDTIRSCRVVVVVAGMEGALASVVGGLIKAPIIAVPTSVGYGANFGGLSALLTMLNSCASGISVVNIDNGFGAGFLASRINRL